MIPKIPKGWKLVPIEPTKEMLEAAYYDAMAESAAGVWREMIGASPEFIEVGYGPDNGVAYFTESKE